MKITINKALSMISSVKERISELVALRQSVANITRFGDLRENTIEPQYNIKDLDNHIVILRKWLLEVDSEIKGANAVNTIEVSNRDILTPLT